MKRSYNIDGRLYVLADTVSPMCVNVEARIAKIIKAVSRAAEVDPDDITGPGRGDPLPSARAAATFVMYEEGIGWPAIARALNRHPSTPRSYRSRFETEEAQLFTKWAREHMVEDKDLQ